MRDGFYPNLKPYDTLVWTTDQNFSCYLEKIIPSTAALVYTVEKKIIWSTADFVRLPTDKEIISL